MFMATPNEVFWFREIVMNILHGGTTLGMSDICVCLIQLAKICEYIHNWLRSDQSDEVLLKSKCITPTDKLNSNGSKLPRHTTG